MAAFTEPFTLSEAKVLATATVGVATSADSGDGTSVRTSPGAAATRTWLGASRSTLPTEASPQTMTRRQGCFHFGYRH